MNLMCVLVSGITKSRDKIIRFCSLVSGWIDWLIKKKLDVKTKRIIRNYFIVPTGTRSLFHQELCFVQSPPITLSTQGLLKVQQGLFKVYISLHLILHHQMSGSSVFSISHNMWYSIHKFLLFFCSIFLSQIITFKIGWLAWSCQRR